MDGSVDTSYEWAETIRLAINALEKETINDCISRPDVLELIEDINDTVFGQVVSKGVMNLRSVQPKKQTGRWIKTIDEDGTEYWLCSKCRCGSDKATNFCPECGSDNRMDSE